MRVGILGCGYVGIALCEKLVTAGHEPIGVRRSEDGLDAITATGAEAIQADVTNENTLGRIPALDAVVFAASSGGRGAEKARTIYVDGLQTVIDHFSARPDGPGQLVYTSSTGVYGDHDGDWVDETTPLAPSTPKAQVLADAETVARSARSVEIDPTVARIAGIYGPDRWGIARYVDRPVTEGYRNHIHRDDVAGAIVHLLETGAEGHDVVLLVDDEPVDRWTFADWLADQLDKPEPPKRTVAERLEDEDVSERAIRRLRTSKRCRNDRLHEVGYTFTYPTYREGYRASIEAYPSST